MWKEKAQRIVEGGTWPDNITHADRYAVEYTAGGDGTEPYYTVKIVIESILGGYYKPVRG